MTRLKVSLSCLLLIAIATERSFVDTAPTTSSPPTRKGSPEVVPETLDANVRELESLKQTIGKTLEMMKSQSAMYANINGHSESRLDSNTEVMQDGKLVAGLGASVQEEQPSADAPATGSLRINVDMPERNIHKSTVQLLNRPQTDTKRAFGESGDVPYRTGKLGGGGNQYTALDMAQYVFWTGDEKGVTLAIEEFLQTGLMTREEAISYLQEIKYNLEYLQNHYQTQFNLSGSGSEDRSKASDYIAQQLLKARESLSQLQDVQHQDVFQNEDSLPSLKTNFDLNKFRFQAMKKRVSEETSGDSDNSDELLERLKVADFLYTEYSLEEIIYQLAKVMFTQGLARGSSDAQQALQKFTKFLESEAELGHISRTLEKKVLDVLIAALADTLGDHPEIQTIREYAQEEDRQRALRQIMQMIPQEKDAHVDIQLKADGRDPFVDLTKYRTLR